MFFLNFNPVHEVKVKIVENSIKIINTWRNFSDITSSSHAFVYILYNYYFVALRHFGLCSRPKLRHLNWSSLFKFGVRECLHIVCCF